MKTYVIRRLPEGEGRLALGGIFDPSELGKAWKALEQAQIDHYPWDENGYRPETFAKVGWNAKGLHVLMASNEPEIRQELSEVGGMACFDSCLEFFLMPNPRTGAYANFEVTPRAIMHLGVGDGRHGRAVYKELPDGVDPTHSAHDGGWWAVSYTAPAAFLKAEFGVELAPNMAMRGNFYKCGDKTCKPHYGIWHPYALARADFHRPELFADFILE